MLTGTLLRSGDQIRAAIQLVEAPGGAGVVADRANRAGRDLPAPGRVTRRIVESLAVPLSAGDEHALQRDAPSDPKAYELYLRANQISLQSTMERGPRPLPPVPRARPRVRAGVGAARPRLPRHGAVRRRRQRGHLLRAGAAAFRRALELSPALPSAHHLYTNVEVDLGRAEEAMVRLLGRLRERPNDAELYGGLVHSCRYCGLLDASIAAHEHAIRLDPAIRTSVARDAAAGW